MSNEVAIVMGSDSDWPVMEAAAKVGIPLRSWIIGKPREVQIGLVDERLGSAVSIKGNANGCYCSTGRY